MRKSDQFGYEVTFPGGAVAADAAIPIWNKVVLGFLAHSAATSQHLDRLLDCAPDFGLAHASHGLFCLLLGRGELIAVAREDLRKAEASAFHTPVTERERALTQALNDWLCGFPTQAADGLDRALLKYPADAFLVKLVHAIRFILGDASGMRVSVERVLQAYDESHPAFGYVLGCHAFTLEESGEYDAAECAGRRGLEIAPDDAWGLHAVAHVYDMTARSQAGVLWLEERPGSWAHCNNFRYHVWWHLALMYLDRGDFERVLALYDQEIRCDHTDDYRDISNAASLLTRLEIEGVKVGGRWRELADFSARRGVEGCSLFADLHYLMAVLGDGRTAVGEKLMRDMRHNGEGEKDMSGVARRCAVPAAAGLEAYRKGNFFSAYHHLNAARPTLQGVGGSYAQRDVFEQLAIDAALRSGLANEAERLINERTDLRSVADRFARERMTIVERMKKAARLMEDENLRATAR